MIQYRHVMIFRDSFRYVLGPCITVAPNGDWLCSFNMGVRREVGKYAAGPWQHPPYDPEYRNYLVRSTDRGETWDCPRVVPGYEWFGVEHLALLPLRNGEILGHHYQRKFLPLETAQKTAGLLGAWHKEPYTWVVAHGGTYVHRSRDNGLTWSESVEVPTFPYISGYSPRPGVEMPDGTILLPLAAADPFYDIHHSERKIPGGPHGNEWDENGRMKVGKSAAFVAISGDGGHSWVKTREIARDANANFYEPTLARLASGRLIAHLRASSDGGYLYQVTSDDGGLTWCKPWRTAMWGFPAHIVQLADGRVLTVYGYRREPFGVRACVSMDDGNTWDMAHEFIIGSSATRRPSRLRMARCSPCIGRKTPRA
jgi:sialidase-1